ncbi:Calx-beta domain-containing protein [Xanthobacter sediminis]
MDYHTVAGTAGTDDFSASSGTISFAPGETTKLVRIPVTADTVAEGNEHFSLVLTDANGAVIGVAEGVATITDDDEAAPALPTLSIADARAVEGDAGEAGALAFTVSLSAASHDPVTVSFHTADGTALAGSDYTGTSGTFTIAAGETSATIRVPVIGDDAVEADERFSVVLTSATGATIADGTATGTIVNDDAAAPSGGAGAVAFAVTDDWASGFVGTMTLTPEASLHGWTVAFDAPFDITNIWNAEIVSHEGDHYVVRNAAWNGDVAGASAVTFGFQGTPGGGGAVANGFAVNGVPVGAGAAHGLSADDAGLSALLSHLETNDAAFNAEITVHNAGDALTRWMLEIDTPYQITGVTGAEILSHTADGYVIGSADGHGGIGANDEVTFSVAGTGRFDPSHFGLLV